MPSDMDNRDDLRKQITGFGDNSIRKSFYPQIQKQLEDLEHFRTMVDASVDAIMEIKMSSGIIVDFNKRAEEMFGQSSSQLRGSSIYDLLPTGSATDMLELYVKNPGKNLKSFVISIMINGVEKIIELSLAHNVVRNEDFLITVARDITKRCQAENELRQVQKLDAIGRIAGGVAHDFNNLLNGVIGFAELIQRNAKGMDKVEYYAGQILKSATRATDLAQQLLTFSRKTEGKHSAVDIHQLVEEVISIVKQTVNKQIELKFMNYVEDFYVFGDATQLQSVILNLVINARDALGGQGKIILETSVMELDAMYCHNNPYKIDEGHYCVISVTDNGPGIPAEIQGQIFEPFFTTKEKGKGTGLGLSTAYGIIKDHKGSISVYSEINKGTCFKIYLPIYSNESETDVTETSNGFLPLMPGTGRILVVEDEPIISEVATTLLEDMGYEVLQAEDGYAAEEVLRANCGKIDLVLLDMIMPGRGGHEVFSSLRKICPEVKILLASGLSLNDDIQDCLDNGAVGFIQKPYLSSVLSKAIAEAMLK